MEKVKSQRVYVQEEDEDIDEIIFGGINESDEDDSTNASNIEKSTAADKRSKITQVNCDECGKTFRNSDRLKSHQRGEHEGQKLVPISQKNQINYSICAFI